MSYMTEREILQAGAEFVVGKVNGVSRISLNQDVDRATQVHSMDVSIYFHDGRCYKAPVYYGGWIQIVREAASSIMIGE